MTEAYERLTSLKYGYQVTSQEKVPTPALLEAIDKHFAYRHELRTMRKSLEDRTYQFRIIQKKLLNRFKDKNPSALNNLDFLLMHTYGQVIETGNQMEALKGQQAHVAVQLANAIICNNLLIKILCGMESD